MKRRPDFRESAEHATDIGAAVTWARQTFGKPVLVMHHEQDACQVCPPQRLPEPMTKLPAGSKLMTYGGGRSEGPVCEAFAYQGFNGIEARVVADLSAWIVGRK
jgi:hypothetical protein